jgi:hypothetical protein
VTTPAMSPFERLATEVAAAPHVIENLCAAHVADAAGCCASCTRNGAHTVSWPCPTRQLAEYAAQHRPGGVTLDADETVRQLDTAPSRRRSGGAR